MKHKHADVIKAWADGAVIEAYNPEYQKWIETSNPGWFPDIEYRIKPDEEPRLRSMYVYNNPTDGRTWIDPNERYLGGDWYYVGRIEVFK